MQNLAKLGVQQGNNPLAGLAGLLKRNSSGRGSFSKKTPKSPQKSQGSPVVLPKKKKKPSLEVPPSPISARLGSEPPQSLPKSPKSFLRGLRRSSSRSKKKGDGADDMASETSSVVSLPIHTSLDETPRSADITPTVSPLKKAATPKTNGIDGSLGVSENGGFAPMHTSSPAPQPQLVPLRDKNSSTSPSEHRKTTDSAIFKTGSYENLFSSSSNLFDSKELDALMGKKEKTPDREPKVDKNAPDDATVSPIPKKKVNEKKSNGPTPVVAIHPVILPKPEKKRSVDSSIRANLHRYESNSSVSKESLASDSIIKEEPKMESVSESAEPPEKPTEDVQEKPDKSPPETRKKSSLLFEEGDDDLFGPSVKTDKGKATPDKPEVDIRKASLFDDEDELFAADKPSRDKREASPAPMPSKKVEDLFGDSLETEVPEPSKKKTRGLFDDSLVEKKDVDPKVPEPSKKSLFDDSWDAEIEKKDIGTVFEDITPVKREDNAETRRMSEEDVLAKVEDRKKKEEADTKKKDDVDFSGPPEVEKKGEDLFGDAIFDDIAHEAKTESPKHASLFDEDVGSSSLFTRERKALKTSATKDTHVPDTKDLFSGISPKTSPKTERAKMVKATDVDSFDPLGAINTQADDEQNGEVEKANVKSEGSTVLPAEDAKDNLIADSKATEEVTETTTEEVGKAKEKESVSPKHSTASKSDSKPSSRSSKEETGKPAWMAELKKRKDGATPPAAAPKKKEPVEPMPEWKKRALERKKKAESGENSPLSSRKKEPVEAPIPEWKKRALERKKKAEEAKLSDSRDPSPSTKVGHSSPTKSPRTGRKAGSPLSERKSPNVSATDAAAEKKELSKSPLTSEGKSKTEREEEEKEGTKKEEPYKTRRQREREQKEKEEKEKELKEKEKTEEGSTTIEEKAGEGEKKEKEEETKEAEKTGTTSSVTRRSKTRQEREKEREEMRRKADAEVAELKKKYQAKREKEREEREKERKARYKTKKEREQEAKEKEEKEKKDAPITETSTAKATDISSPTKTKPALAKKPSIEIISRKKLSSASKSSDVGDDEKSSKVSQADNNQKSRDTDDDVFSTGDVSEPRSASNLSLRRTPSPKIAIDALTTVLTSPEADGKLKNGHTKEEGEGRKKTSLTITTTSTVSPTHSQNGSTSNKNSVSSDSDLLAEPKPTRSQTVSLSSRSPTPPALTGKSDSVPEWKRQLIEKKKLSSPIHKNAPKKVELPDTDSNIPQWKKELLAKKKAKPEEKVREMFSLQRSREGRFLNCYRWGLIAKGQWSRMIAFNSGPVNENASLMGWRIFDTGP